MSLTINQIERRIHKLQNQIAELKAIAEKKKTVESNNRLMIQVYKAGTNTILFTHDNILPDFENMSKVVKQIVEDYRNNTGLDKGTCEKRKETEYKAGTLGMMDDAQAIISATKMYFENKMPDARLLTATADYDTTILFELSLEKDGIEYSVAYKHYISPPLALEMMLKENIRSENDRINGQI